MKRVKPSRRRRPIERIARLQRITAALAGACTPLDVAHVLTGEGTAMVRARIGAIYTLSEDGRFLELLDIRGVDGVAEQRLRRVPIESQMNVAIAVRSGESSWIEREEQWAFLALDAREIRSERGLHALASLPLAVGGRTIGALAFAFDTFRTFPRDERALLLTMARQGAQALERAQLYDAVLRARAEAESANRRKDEFLARISHELRTPSAAMAMWLHALAHGRPEERSHAIAGLTECVDVQATLVEDLLDIARGISGKLHIERIRVDLASLILSAVSTLRHQASAKELVLRCALAVDVPIVIGDPSRLRQVMTNLITNAIKFTPPGGTITVRLFGQRGAAHVEVADTGLGIAPDLLPSLFTPFKQADNAGSRAHGGLGLGLAIVRQIVELHGGTVVARSPGEGRGATFAIALPPADAADVERSPADAERRGLEGSGPTG